MIRTVLFDLDGTLADTAPDLAFALNELLTEQNKPTLPIDQIRSVVSHGGKAIIELGFGNASDVSEFEVLRKRFLHIYQENLTNQTTLFPGMDELLTRIETNNLSWGIVTNKPAWLTSPLMKQLNLTNRAASIISGDTLPQRKPHPAPMLLACKETGSKAAECLYVGDAERDILAGNNAGMKTLVALYGYIGANDTPDSWNADGSINHPLEVLDWLS